MGLKLAKLSGNLLQKPTRDSALDKSYSSYNFHGISAALLQAGGHSLSLPHPYQVSSHSGAILIWSQHRPCLPISLASFLMDFTRPPPPDNLGKLITIYLLVWTTV